MKCYLINLDRSADRLKNMEYEFGRYEIPFIRVSAVDGKMLSHETKDALLCPPHQLTRQFTDGEIGCFLSHKKCFEMIVDGDEPYAAIFEDDVILSCQIPRFLNSDGWILNDADFIKIEKIGRPVQLENLHNISGFERKIGRIRSRYLGTGGYIVSKKGAKRVLLAMDKIYTPVDELFFDPASKLFSQLNTYLVVPALCVQSDAISVIGEERLRLSPVGIKAKLSLPARILREIVRPYKRSAHIVAPDKLWERLTTKKRWLRVPFR